MTRQKSFKRRVRARMAKTGESYTAARRMLIARGVRPDAPKAGFKPWVAPGKMQAATGRDWEGWFALLDAEGAERRPHPEIARLLMHRHGVAHWWAQTITVGYEQARGLREPGQKADGWAVSASKTVAAPVELLYAAFVDDALRARWLPDADLGLRKATPHKSARYDWEDGETRVHVAFLPAGDAKSRIAVSHERLPDGDTAAEMKGWWRDRVAALKAFLEGCAIDG